MSKHRAIAFYLPQFYPTPENNEWWEPGFTEWTNVVRAKPLFKGHYQPRVPQELSFYDLRVPETRQRQAELAKEAGIEGFCYWHYWFGNGRRLLSEVFKEVVDTKQPNFPFCLCWANHSWYQKTWDPNKPNRLLVEQTYPGLEDFTAHFNEMLPAFKDERYLKSSDGRLIFGVYCPLDIKEFELFKDTWNNLAHKNGLRGFYFFGFTFDQRTTESILSKGYDACVLDQVQRSEGNRSFIEKVCKNLRRRLTGYPNHATLYDNYVSYTLENTKIDDRHHPCIDPNFDHSPRSANKGVILYGDTPHKWNEFLKKIIKKSSSRSENLIFVKAWNEWGEGNYLEPDSKWGRQYIDATADALKTKEE